MRNPFNMFCTITIPLLYIIIFSTSVHFHIKNQFPPSEEYPLLLEYVSQPRFEKYNIIIINKNMLLVVTFLLLAGCLNTAYTQGNIDGGF